MLFRWISIPPSPSSGLKSMIGTPPLHSMRTPPGVSTVSPQMVIQCSRCSICNSGEYSRIFTVPRMGIVMDLRSMRKPDCAKCNRRKRIYFFFYRKRGQSSKPDFFAVLETNPSGGVASILRVAFKCD